MPTTKLLISGANAQQRAESLVRFIEARFGIIGNIMPQTAPLGHAIAKSLSDHDITKVALIIALPAFVNESLNLAARMELTQKVETLIEWVAEQKTEASDLWHLDRRIFIPPFIPITRRPVQALAERAMISCISMPDSLKLDQAYGAVFCLRT
ncbi:MAG: hypothetical protein GXP10_09090 [Gammaproteobacteria bacterium]|nr:hypothetical protein [Gammaproteobacteria bacterium]